jgi:hypothetical protein
MKSWFWQKRDYNLDIAPNSGINVGSVETIIHEHLLLKKVCVQ